MKEHKPAWVILFILCLVQVALLEGSSMALPAFPGAQGFGSPTPGGRGGKVIQVTNLSNSGTGSLRAACEAGGARIVVFRTGGLIDLSSDIYIDDPYLTIAGQTAPGGGICIRGGAIRVRTHDVIIRGLRVRPGFTVGTNNDAYAIQNNSVQPYNIIVDHCSGSWTVDEQYSSWYPAHDYTFSWNIISQAGYGMLIGNYAKNLSVHHNLFAHITARGPLFKGDTRGEVINNVVYDWENSATRVKSLCGPNDTENMPSFVNVIGNYYKAGPGTNSRYGVDADGLTSTKIYVYNNIGPTRTSNTAPQWNICAASAAYQSSTPAMTGSGIAAEDPNSIYATVLDYAGARVPQRDSVDANLVNEVRNGTGHRITSDPGWPSYAAGAAPADADHDGMPDSWEQARGLNASDASDASRDRNGDGYTNIEEYVNALIPVPNGGNGSDQTAPAAPRNLHSVNP
ncbi:MAG: hypothetical protein AB1640_18370 [bacterium]